METEAIVWRKNVPILYDVFAEQTLEWPSLTVEWLPGSEPCTHREGYESHRLLFGTHTAEGAMNELHVARVELPSEDTEIDNTDGEVTGANVDIVSIFPSINWLLAYCFNYLLKTPLS